MEGELPNHIGKAVEVAMYRISDPSFRRSADALETELQNALRKAAPEDCGRLRKEFNAKLNGLIDKWKEENLVRWTVA